MMIYNTDYDQIQTYTKTAWSGITGSKDLGIECASSMDCASGFCVDSVCCDTSVENCNGDCEACNLAGTIGYCTVRTNLDNTEVTSTCWYCNGTNDTSLAYTGYTGVNCTGSNACFSGTCFSSYCDEDNDTHFTTSVAQCPSGRFQSTAGDDCCDSDNRTYLGQTAYATSINACGSWDHDCDGNVTKGSTCSQVTTCTPSGSLCCPSGYTQQACGALFWYNTCWAKITISQSCSTGVRGLCVAFSPGCPCQMATEYDPTPKLTCSCK